jgi:sugar lactone lactonase YvrE
LRALPLALALAAAAACHPSPSNGFAVDVTLSGGSVSAAVLASVRTLAIVGSGAESASADVSAPSGLSAEERLVYRPRATSGALTLTVTALDGNGQAVAAGATSVTLRDGQTVTATITLHSVAPQPHDVDLATPPADMATPPPDFSVTPTSATVGRNGTVAFIATVPCTWSIVEPSGGSVDGSGNYTAPAFAGTFHVAARSGDGSSVTMTVVVQLGNSVTVAGAPGGCGIADGVGGSARFGVLNAQITSDNSGNLYVGDVTSDTIRKIAADGTVTTIAGIPTVAGDVNAADPLMSTFNAPHGIAVGGNGTIYVSESIGQTIRAIGTGGVTTLVGTAGTAGYAEATLGVNALVNTPYNLALDGVSGTLYFTDSGNELVRRAATSNGGTALVAGTQGTAGSADSSAPPVTFDEPDGIAYDGTNVYVADLANDVIRSIVAASGTVSTLAGTAGMAGYTDAQGASARFSSPESVAAGGGKVYVGDTVNRVVRVIDSGGNVGTVAGVAGTTGSTDNANGHLATFNNLEGIAVVGQTLYVNDGNNCTVRKIALSSTAVSTFAGTAAVTGTTDGDGTTARLGTFLGDMVADGQGNIYLSDESNDTIRKLTVTASGGGYTSSLVTIAGTAGVAGAGDGVGLAATFNAPKGLYLAGTFLYVADYSNNRIRRVDLANKYAVSTTAPLPAAPSAVAGDEGGNLYVTAGSEIIAIASGGSVRTLWGSTTAGSSDGVGVKAGFGSPFGIVYDHARHLYVADSGNANIRRVDLDSGLVDTIAGTAGMHAYLDGVGTAARFWQPKSLLLDPSGALLVTDQANSQLVRRIDLTTGTVTTLLGRAGRGAVIAGATPSLNAPRGLALLPTGELVVGSQNEAVILLAY